MKNNLNVHFLLKYKNIKKDIYINIIRNYFIPYKCDHYINLLQVFSISI